MSDFDYRTLRENLTEPEIDAYVAEIRKEASVIAGRWDKELHAEWLTRLYLALKLCAASGLMFDSERYCRTHNVRIVEPYLLYYATFAVSRALLLTGPARPWKGGSLYTIGHKAAIKAVADELSRLRPAHGELMTSVLNAQRTYRELLSYSFPTTGLDIGESLSLPSREELLRVCWLIAEVAQLNSEIFELALTDAGVPSISVSFEALRACFQFHGVVIDSDDARAAEYMSRKVGRPSNLYWSVREGWEDDVQIPWEPSEDMAAGSYFPTFQMYGFPYLPIE